MNRNKAVIRRGLKICGDGEIIRLQERELYGTDSMGEGEITRLWETCRTWTP